MDERISRASAGDLDALTSLFIELHDELEAHLQGQMSAALRAKIEPDDLLNETFIAAFGSVAGASFPTEQAFRGWLWKIANHRLIEAARNLQAKKRGGDMVQAPNQTEQSGSLLNLWDAVNLDLSTASVKVSREEGLQELHKQLAALPEDDRRVLELTYLEGLSTEAAAAALGRTPGAVRAQCGRARKKLAALMGGSSLFQFRQ